MVNCLMTGAKCSHKITQEDDFIFVIMPFKGFDAIYSAIQDAVKGITEKKFRCYRADEKFSTHAIWCANICANIQKAKYLIVDTTGKNPNVFYELGFSHAQKDTKAILITQNVKDLPFDVAELNYIKYSKKNIHKLKKDLRKAIRWLESKETEKRAFILDEAPPETSNIHIIKRNKKQLSAEPDTKEQAKRWYEKAYHESEENDYKNAIRDYSKAIILDPKFTKAYNNRGNAHYALNAYDDAIKDFKKSISLSPNEFITYANLAELLIITGNYKKALKIIEVSPKSSPETEDIAVRLFLECITKKLLGQDVSGCEKELRKVLRNDFEITWSFNSTETWLAHTHIEENKKAYITEKLEQLKVRK